jgi:uncharacterized coiled-coil DUF342 family protein
MTQKQEKMLAVGTMGLLASIFGNLAQAEETQGLKARNKSLRQGEATLRSLLTDWQQAYQEIDAQLSQAMRLNAELHRTNDELGSQVADLRRARDIARAEVYQAGQRAIELQTLLGARESELQAAKRELKELKLRTANVAATGPKQVEGTKATGSSKKGNQSSERGRKKAASGRQA